MVSRSFLSLTLALGVGLSAAPAAADNSTGGNIDLNPFRFAMDSRGYITVNASQVLGHKELSFGLVTNWGRGLLSLESGMNTYEVSNIITPTLIGAFGLKFGVFELELGASVPFQVMDGDRGPDDLGDPGNPNDDRSFGIEGQGLGDVGLHAKTRFLSTSKGPKIGLGLMASIYLPTASESNKFIGEAGPVPQVLAIVDKEFGEQRRLRLAANAGIRLRLTDEEFVDDGNGGLFNGPTTGQRIRAGNAIPFGGAIAYAVSAGKIDLIGEVFGAVPLGGENFFPLEAVGGVKVYLARNSFLSFGGGAGLMPSEAGNPGLRAFLAIVFEPQIGDRDGDGIKDDVDMCPDDPEDFDDFEDEDGCPDPDNDRDGILDVDDQCPNEPEDKDGFEDEDGCPEGNQMDRDGDGILDDEDQCPDDPEDFDGFEDEDGCPDPDNDGDGILDVDDLCPDDPEDFDGFEDQDGCPDPDNDKDRILDVDDQCPNEPETYNGFEDEDGCPDRGRVVVTDTNIEILDKIYFEYNKATIKSESFPILDAVAATLQSNPDIQLIEIQGHTDERGSDSYNLKLSDDRAKSVRQYLVDKGIDRNRLEAQGYGETQPLDRRSNEEAWAKNRRVEFLILKRANQ